jgi:hypothetical protein
MKRQLRSNISFGNISVYTAEVGKNGGHYYEQGIGWVNNYSSGFELVDARDKETRVFSTMNELMAYLEFKYRAEIEKFNYMPEF